MYSPSKYSRLSSNLSQGSQGNRPPGPKGKRVQVWTRIRPTAHFAHDSLELLPDGQVSEVLFEFTLTKILNVLHEFTFTIILNLLHEFTFTKILHV